MTKRPRMTVPEAVNASVCHDLQFTWLLSAAISKQGKQDAERLSPSPIYKRLCRTYRYFGRSNKPRSRKAKPAQVRCGQQETARDARSATGITAAFSREKFPIGNCRSLGGSDAMNAMRIDKLRHDA